MAVEVYLERGSKRVFAGAIEWPGWSRSGRDEDAALQALADYGHRYKKALGRAAANLAPPKGPAELAVVQRLKGDATTDFGAPGKTPSADRRPLGEREADRWAAILRSSWRAFDRAADAAVGVPLRKGPRGGGRELDAMVAHVLDPERAYVTRLGGTERMPSDREIGAQMAAVRDGFVEAFLIRARGEPAPKPRRSGKLWAPRYAVRRSAWHALDHAWEIE